MEKLVIHPGACGFLTTVSIRPAEGKRYGVVLESDCETVRKLGETLPELDRMDCFKRFVDNPVYVRASATLRHASCPVPCGILKALEVAAGLGVPKDVMMRFEEEADRAEEAP